MNSTSASVHAFLDPHPHELPILDDLRRLETDEARTDWLLRLPLFLFVSRWKQLRDALDECGFRAGVAYIEAEAAALHAKRLPDGTQSQSTLFAVHLARIDLKVAARVGRPC